MKKKTVKYRVGCAACMDGFIDVTDCATVPPVVFDMVTGDPVPDAKVTPAGDCPMEVVVMPNPQCEEPPEPPEPITLDGEDCEGAPVAATGLPGQITHVVQAPGTAFRVVLCEPPKDIEKVVLCDTNTDHKVAVISDLTDPLAPVVNTWDLNTGAPWAGDMADLQACGDSDLESDAELACDNGTEFLRWFVKKDGEPTGLTYDTDIGGAPYAAGGPVTLGKCVIAEPPPEPIDAPAVDCDGAPVTVTGMPGELMSVVQVPGTVFTVQLCEPPKDAEQVVMCAPDGHKVAIINDITDPAAPVTYFWDLNTGAAWTGDVADLQTCSGSTLESDGQVACDSGTEFLRWFIKQDGEPTGIVFDTDVAGAPYTVTGTVTLGKCVAAEPPPEPVELEGVDCDGAPVALTGAPGELTSVVQAAGTVFKVQLCEPPKDIEKVVMCDSTNDHKVAIVNDLTDPAAPVTYFWDLNTGAPWTGDVADLQACGDSDLESDAELACNSGVEFLRWFVKKDGVPTGLTYDTDIAGAPYTAAGTVTLGKCVIAAPDPDPVAVEGVDCDGGPVSITGNPGELMSVVQVPGTVFSVKMCEPPAVCTPTISSAFADALGTLLPGTSISIQKDNCCAIKVGTSAGDFIVATAVTGYSTADFACPVTVTSVEILTGTCALADIVVTTQFKG